MSSVTNDAVSAIWRIESSRLLGGLVRFVRDLDFAEDLAQEALVVALETWPEAGIPDNPGAWLMTTAKNRAVDVARRRRMMADKQQEVVESFGPTRPGEPFREVDVSENVGDDVLRLILIACHPVLSKDHRVALTLRLLGGLTTEEIARAFLTPEATIAQRIVRAKRTLTAAHVPFEVPEGKELLARMPAVLEVIYLIFNEGYTAAAGEDWMRPELCQDAMRLGRILAALVPDEAEVHGLVALMELQASRMRARLDASGNAVLLLDQNRARWDRPLIAHGLAALRRAERQRQPLGVYTLQAAIAACHANATSADQTDWAQIVALYDALVEATQSPVVELNRAVAVGMAFGPGQALALVEALIADNALADYPYLYAVYGDTLEKLGFREAASTAFEKAAALTKNARERAVMLDRGRRLVRAS